MFTALLLAAGCAGYPPSIDGAPVWKMFPFDGERSWDYLSNDVAATYKLNTTSVGEAETIGGTNVYTLSTVKECVGNDEECVDGDLVYRMSWSSDSIDGVQVWGYSVGDEPYVEMRPPVLVAKTEMLRDESVDTTTGGVVWTSTMLGIQSCPIRLVAEWDECAVLEVTVDGGPTVPLAGTWYATAGNGVAAFQHEGEDGRWELSDIDCQGECTGEW
jgi:hypothetical protein